jgi:hypothetical protein
VAIAEPRAEAVAVLVAGVGRQYRRLSRIDVTCRMGAPDIFVSYAREDQARVAPVVAALEARGWSVFWDRRIPAGQTWRSHIGQALEKARCVVVAWSEHAVRSEWVIEEADEGKRREVLVPVFLDAVLPPWGFRGIQAADLSGWSPGRPSPDFDSFLADLGAVLGAPQQGSPPPSPAAETSPAKRVVGDGDEPTTSQQVAAVDPGGGDGIAGPLAGSMVDTSRAAKTSALPAGQPTHAVDASARREVEIDPPPLPVGEERSAEALPPSGLLRPAEAPHAAPHDAVLAEQARSRRIGPKSKIGRRGLGMALVVGTILAAGGYAYLGLRSPPEPAPANPEAAHGSEEVVGARPLPEPAPTSQKAAPTQGVAEPPSAPPSASPMEVEPALGPERVDLRSLDDTVRRPEDALTALRSDPHGSFPADPAKTRVFDLRGEVLEVTSPSAEVDRGKILDAQGEVLEVTSPSAEVGKGRILDFRGGELAVEGPTSGVERRISPY